MRDVRGWGAASGAPPHGRTRVSVLYSHPFDHEVAAYAAGDRPSHTLRWLPELTADGVHARHVRPPIGLRDWLAGHLKVWHVYSAVVAAMRRGGRHHVALAVQEDVAAPLLLLKRLHLYRGRLVVMNIALICDNNRVGFRRWLWSQLLRGASAVVSHTRVHADAVPTTFEVEPERSHFMHFAVDETWFASFPWAPSHLAPQVVAAGHAGRDYELLIDAAAIMPDVQFVILSSQDNIDRLRATRSDPPGNVLIRLGDLSHRELAGCIASCDVAVLPLVESQVSTGQTVLLELMAMGVATVVSDVSGVADYITAGVRTVPPGDLGALVAAVRRLLDQPDEASALGECAKDQVRRFTAQRTWPRMSELLFPERDPAGRPPALLDADATSVSPAAEPR